MAKSAAQIAEDLSSKKSHNKNEPAVVEADETGGIHEDDEVEVPPTVMVGGIGSPFDLVEGRPMIDFFGPLDAYGFVTTRHGEYAIPYGKILRFEYRKEFDKKEGREVIRPYPVYEDAPAELVAYVVEAAKAAREAEEALAS